MDKQKALDILESGKLDDIKELLGKVKIDQILKIVRNEVVKNKPGSISLVRSLFQASKGIEKPILERRFSIYTSILNLLRQNIVPSNFVTEILCFLLIETDSLLSNQLSVLCKIFTEALDKGEDLTNKWIEIYPRVLSTLALRDVVEVDDNTYTGVGFKAEAIDHLISLKWRIYAVPHIVSLFIDLELTDDERLRVIKKCLFMLKELDIMDAPVLILHLLRLAEKGHRGVVLEGIIKFFNERDKVVAKNNETLSEIDEEDIVTNASDSADRLLEAEGNSIVHISMSIDINIEALKDLLKVLNANKLNQEFVLSPFCLALCLSKKTKATNDNVPMIDFLKSSIFKCFEEHNQGQKSSWLRSMSQNNFDVSIIFTKTILNSKSGWDFILENLVDLGLDLIKTYGSKVRVVRHEDNKHMTATERACILGQNILLETYKAHDFVMPTILDQLLKYLWIRPYPAVLNIIDLLSLFVEEKPRPLLKAPVNKLKQFLEYLPMLDPNAAVALLNALMPLLKLSSALKDGLMVVLRKSMYNRKSNARKVSALGYLLVLKKFKVLGSIPFSQSQSEDSSSSISQVWVEFHCARYNCTANDGLCYELLEIIRHSLDRQSDNKQIIYQGLNEVMVKNPNLSAYILELFLGRFEKYFKWDERIQPPIALSSCVDVKLDEPILLEPIGHLIMAICTCLINYKKLPITEDDPEMEANAEKLTKGLQSLSKRIITSDLEDFELDKSSEYNVRTSVGLKNQMLASQLLGVIEALMDWVFKTGNLNLDSCKEFDSLFHQHHRLLSAVQEKSAAKGKKRKDDDDDDDDDNSVAEEMPPPKAGKSNVSKNPDTIANRRKLLSLDMISQLFQFTFYNTSTDEPESQALLRENEPLLRYCLETVEQTIELMVNYSSDESDCETLATITRCMMKIYSHEFEIDEENAQRKKRNYRTRALVCMQLLFNITKHFCDLSDHTLLHKFLFNLKSKSIQSQTASFKDVPYTALSGSLIKSFIKNITRELSDDFENMQTIAKLNKFKEITQMTNFIQLLACRQESFRNNEGDVESQNIATFKWVKEMCMQQKIDNVTLGSAFLSLFLELTHQQKLLVDENPYLDMAVGIRLTIGSFDDEKTLNEENKFGIINDATAATGLSLLIQHLDRILSEITWILDVVKARGATSDHSKLENRMCKRISIVIATMEHILQIAVKTGIDSIAKFAIKIYNFLSNFAKYNQTLYNKKLFENGKVCSNFEKIVKLCGHSLNPPVLEFIGYVEEKSEEGTATPKKTRNSASEKSRIVKETKHIPNLSFAQEQFYHFLLILGKKAKIDFSSHIKSGVSRDFRINMDEVAAVLDNDNDDNESIAESTASEQSSKRSRVDSSSKLKRPKTSTPQTSQAQTSKTQTSPNKKSQGNSQTAKRGRSKLGRSKP